MFRFEIPEVVWGILFGIVATVVIGGAAFTYLPSPLEMFGEPAAECRQPQDAKEKNTSEQREYECLVAAYTRSLSNFTKWLVVVTTAVALFGFWQVMVSRNTAKRQLRAYIGMYGESITLLQVSGQSFLEGYVSLKNFGQTPAYGHSCWVRIDVTAAAQPPFNLSASGLTRAIIAPDGEANLPVHWGPVSAQDMSDIRNEIKRIFVWGAAEYVDAFGHERYFRFYYWNAKETPGKGWGLIPSDKPDEAN
jgi:hypothetical protein